MGPLLAVLSVLILFLPLHWLVRRHFNVIGEGSDLRRYGIVIEFESALEARSAPIGTYRGTPIPGTVTFKTMLYRYDRVLDPRLRGRIGPGELFVAPGLVYVAVQCVAADGQS